ncbi:MAG: 6-phosphogluconolactonase [Halioglobus sp.]|nr:6-phosphogluconolactonase [Halioglobus sp.]
MSTDFHQFETNEELVHQLANSITGDLGDAISKRGLATMAVSGGFTPRPLFEQLSQCPLDWSQVTVTQVDERWIAEQHADSNARLIREHMLQNHAAAAKFVSIKTQHSSPFDAEKEAAKKLSAFAGPIDVVVLGMGEDGHTASFFPHVPSLIRALNCSGKELCVAVSAPHARHRRMTLTLPTLLRARNLYLHITGEAKWEVLQRAIAQGPVEDLPIRSVLTLAKTPLQIYYASES